jgi:hypothetical protein
MINYTYRIIKSNQRYIMLGCDYVCKGEKEEEIMKSAEEHAVKDH